MNNSQEITRPTGFRHMYLAGLAHRMSGAHVEADPPSYTSASPLVVAFDDGFADGADDSDEPRGDDAAFLAAYSRAIFSELGRIGAGVSAWPDYKTGYVRLDDGLTDEVHDAETLLATLRSLPSGAGTGAMWEATMPIAVACLSWQSCCVVTDRARAEVE